MNSKPAALHILDGRKHFSKEEIRQRLENEIRLGDSAMYPTPDVYSDPVALETWHELKSLYENFSFVSSADERVLSRYCLLQSEYSELLRMRAALGECEYPEPTPEQEEDIRDELGRGAATRFWKKLAFLTSVSGVLQIDKSINSKCSALQAMEDRLFLNPLSRVKNVIKQSGEAETPQSEGEKAGFGNL